MFKRIRKQSKGSVEISLARLIAGFTKAITGLFGLAANLEAQGKDECLRQIEITGRTKSGKEIKGWYGFRAKVGLNPEEFRIRSRKKIDSSSSGSE